MISHAHRAIFVHIPKTGGQSIEKVFVAEVGLSWEERAPLLLQRNTDRSRGPQFLGHLYAAEYVALGHIATREFESYHKFAVVRDPYDRIVSEYRYRNPSGRMSFSHFLDTRPSEPHLNSSRHAAQQTDYLYAGEELLVDEVLRFESLTSDWRATSERVFGRVIELPHENRGRRKPGDLALDPESRARVAATYRDDFARFGYDI